jgi:hypothetical protein
VRQRLLCGAQGIGGGHMVVPISKLALAEACWQIGSPKGASHCLRLVVSNTAGVEQVAEHNTLADDVSLRSFGPAAGSQN